MIDDIDPLDFSIAITGTSSSGCRFTISAIWSATGCRSCYEAVALPFQGQGGAAGRLQIGVIPDRRPDEVLGPEPTNSVDLLLKH